MSPRVAKELRPLLLPWGLAALAAAGHAGAWANPLFAHGELGSFLTGLAGVAFVTGVLVLAAMPIAVELHERTLTLLFSQPTDRLRLWKEKLLAATLAIFALGIVHGAVSMATGQLTLSLAIIYAAFAITAICSVGYHTLATGSILVGIACAVGMPWAVAAIAHLFVYYVLGLPIELSERATLILVVSACAVYSAFFLWLSRRQFVALELRGPAVLRAAEIPEALVPRKLTELFRCRPTGVVANLIRKDVCLQKPIFLVSAVFVVCWLLTLVLMVLHPAWHSNLVAVFHGLTGTQIVLMVILAPCVALGDDKSLGTAAWHLTLPISARRQWFIKLLVTAATLFVVAVVLPVLLATFTLFKAKVGLLALRLNDAPGFLIIGGIVFLVSFWSASMMTNTVRAAIVTMLTLFIFGVVIALAGYLAERWMGGGPLTRLDASSDLSILSVTLLGIAGIAIIGLAQSLRQFRRLETRWPIWLSNLGILAMLIFALTFWCLRVIK